MKCDVSTTCAGVTPCNPNASRMDERLVQLTRTDDSDRQTDDLDGQT